MRALVALVIAFILGILIANATQTPEVDFVERTKIKTVREPAPDPVEVTVIPQACLDAVKFAKEIEDAASNMYAFGDKQLEVISDARKALADGGDLATVENRQRALQGHTVGELYTIEEAMYNFEIVYEDCKESQ
jgi:hypothetical protein